MNILEWIRYIDNIGYIDYDNFLKLPVGLSSYIAAIRTSDMIKQYQDELSDQDNPEIRKKLNNNIQKLQNFFK